MLFHIKAFISTDANRDKRIPCDVDKLVELVNERCKSAELTPHQARVHQLLLGAVERQATEAKVPLTARKVVKEASKAPIKSKTKESPFGALFSRIGEAKPSQVSESEVPPLSDDALRLFPGAM